MLEAGTVICRACPGGDWLHFSKPLELLIADGPAGVAAALARAGEACERGLWAAGWVAYDAAPAFEPAQRARASRPGDPPPLWLGIYGEPRRLAALPAPTPGSYRLGPWQPGIGEAEYAVAIGRIRELIAAGDSYQVNYTYFHHASFAGEPAALFLELARGRHGGLGALVLTATHAAVSTSPELFFSQQGDELVARPMKGTAPRGRWPAEDRAHAAALAASPKERAENVMIVDLLRNDLGSIARPGSVGVPALFEVERYETVLQLTSTVVARTDAAPAATLAALFPCGSVTGAPKIRTTQIIAELEREPRGIYTGAIGWLGPERRACFNVAIRTVEIELAGGRARYGVGGGVTWDSEPAAEHAETLAKIQVLARRPVEFELLETLRWSAAEGWWLLERHLARLRESAEYFDFCCDEEAVRAALAAAVAGRGGPAAWRVRLLLGHSGAARAEAHQLDLEPAGRVRRLALASEPVDRSDRFLFHKTTRREAYERARREHPDADDVLLINERGELTESTIANLVVELAGRRLTPPRECGLLAGVLRGELLERGEIEEGVLRPEDLASASGLWLINSVRGWMEARL